MILLDQVNVVAEPVTLSFVGYSDPKSWPQLGVIHIRWWNLLLWFCPCGVHKSARKLLKMRQDADRR